MNYNVNIKLPSKHQQIIQQGMQEVNVRDSNVAACFKKMRHYDGQALFADVSRGQMLINLQGKDIFTKEDRANFRTGGTKKHGDFFAEKLYNFVTNGMQDVENRSGQIAALAKLIKSDKIKLNKKNIANLVESKIDPMVVYVLGHLHQGVTAPFEKSLMCEAGIQVGGNDLMGLNKKQHVDKNGNSTAHGGAMVLRQLKTGVFKFEISNEVEQLISTSGAASCEIKCSYDVTVENCQMKAGDIRITGKAATKVLSKAQTQVLSLQSKFPRQSALLSFFTGKNKIHGLVNELCKDFANKDKAGQQDVTDKINSLKNLSWFARRFTSSARLLKNISEVVTKSKANISKNEVNSHDDRTVTAKKTKQNSAILSSNKNIEVPAFRDHVKRTKVNLPPTIVPVAPPKVPQVKPTFSS